jgi:2,4-dienoyl-CoA reductase-like NADH-dependent reductase (Old Yellow Enzyme family)/thioredoxin reductase
MYKQLYPNLFKPLRVKNKIFKNRIFSAPNMIYQTVNGTPTEYYISYLEHKARGGACQVALGEVTVDDRGAHTRHFEMSREKMPIYAEMVQAIREHGSIAAIELCHDGAKANPPYNVRGAIGPVSYVREDGVEVTAMTETDMNEVIEAFCHSIDFWKEAGFDAFIIHMGHNWLFSQFFSPLTNKRTDEYGGSPENRMRFPLMALKRIREYVGDDTMLQIRLSGSERTPGGFDVDFAIDFLEKAQEYIDLVEITAEHLWNFISTTYRPLGLNADMSEAIKKSGRVNIPVIVVGAILSPDYAEEIIAAGKADGVSLSRALIADPYFPRKANAGRSDEITPCIRCCLCTSNDTRHLHFKCSVNPLIAREFRIGFGEDTSPAPFRKKVLIIGGGPAGMNAAYFSAIRGHEVILVEKSGSLGGWLKFTDTDSLKKDLNNYKNYLVNRVMSLNIKVLLNTVPDERLLEKVRPDTILIATGSSFVVPTFIKGYEKAYHATDVYFDPDKTDGDSYVIIGGGLIGCETGLHLANIGKKVTILEMADEYARDANWVHRPALLRMIEELKVTVITGAKCTEISDNGVVYSKGGEKYPAKGDVYLYAVGMKSETSLYDQWYDKAENVVLIGDSLEVGKLDGAVHSAFFSAMDIGTIF